MLHPLLYLVLDSIHVARSDAFQLIFDVSCGYGYWAVPQNRVVGWICSTAFVAVIPCDDNPPSIFKLACDLRLLILEVIIDVGLDGLDVCNASNDGRGNPTHSIFSSALKRMNGSMLAILFSVDC